MQPSSAPSLSRRWIVAALLLVAGLAASRLWLIPAHYSSDPNEGWNAFQALRAIGAVGAGPLYPGREALTGNNYPPLSFLLVGAVGQGIGDTIVAGRLVALTAVLGVAWAIYATLRRLGCDAARAVVGAWLFGLLNVTILRHYLALDDPQWLGHLAMVAALPLLLPATPDEEPGTRRVVVAALLMVAGGLVKHNLVAWPIAATLWLALHHRRALIVWLVAGSVAAANAVVLCLAVYGPDMMAGIIAPARDYSLARMAWRSLPAVAVIMPLLWWAWPLVRVRRADRRIDLVLIAVAVAVPLGIVQRSGAGVDINASFEAFIALSIAAALALPPLVERGRRECVAAGLALGALAVVGAVMEAKEVIAAPRRIATWNAMIGRIAAIPGPVACETQAFCYWAGKGFELDFFLYSQRALKAGAAPALDRLLAERRWAGVMIGINGSYNAAERQRDPVIARVTTAMRPAYIDSEGRRLMVPR